MRSLTCVAVALIVVAAACSPTTTTSESSPAPPPSPQDAPAQETAEQLQQLVAPIALYPDALVAQILAASTYPAEVVAADRWMQAHPGLKGDQLGDSVNAQSWDPSVKALTQFPDVLTNLDKNISWTSSLGDAYVNQEQEVMNAVQTMRQRAEQAGKLKSDSQETVTTQSSNIVIQPANPEVVYVPAYDPWTFYGDPIPVWPGWYPVPGIFYDGPYFSWGLGIGIGVGVWGGFDWGWHHWGADWHGRGVEFNHNRYVSRSTTFINRRTAVNRSSPSFSHASNRGSTGGHGFSQGGRGFSQAHGAGGMHSSAFSGFNHGGSTAGFAARGRSSFGGGGFHGGGGGHGGGGHR
jgi:Protein of unknown function (DUF3300)